MSTRDVIRRSRPKVHEVQTDEGPVYVRALSGTGRQKYLDIAEEAGDKFPAGRVAALALCEADGTPSYDPDKEDDVRECSEMGTPTLDAICLKLVEVSGLTKKAGDDAEKKSVASTSA